MEPASAPASLSGEVWPLSSSQREVWLDQLAFPGSTHLNIGGCGFLVGELDEGLYREALKRLVAETEALRMVLLSEGRLRLLDRVDARLEVVDIGTSSDPRRAMRELWEARIREPFSIDEAPPWRFILLRDGAGLHGITIQFHHLVMDGWGTTLIARRWAEIYGALVEGRPVPQSGQGRAYRDYIEASQAYSVSADHAADEAFWRIQLPVSPAPLIERRTFAPSAGVPLAWVQKSPFSRSGYRQLQAFADGHRLSAFAVVLGALALYFSRTRHRNEVVIGVPHFNRGGKRYFATPGMFVGVFALPIPVQPSVTALEFVREVNGRLREALLHARFALSEVSRRLGVSGGGVFDILFSFERQDYALSFGRAKLVESRQLFSGHARYPLGVTLCEFDPLADLEWVLEGSRDHFERGEVELLSARILHLVQAMMGAPESRLEVFDPLPGQERDALVRGLHGDVPRAATVQPYIQRFMQQARLRPQASALVWEGGEMRYGDLAQAALRLAGRLVVLGAARERIVALALPRGRDHVVAMLAVSLAGAAFLPLDETAPLAFLLDIVEQAQPLVVLVSGDASRLSVLSVPLLAIDAVPDVELPPLPEPEEHDLAYVLFTSGSTGRPKGVMVEHGALARRLGWLARHLATGWTDRSAQVTRTTFDPSLIEICLPLVHGGSIALPPPGAGAVLELADFVRRFEVTMLALVPASLAALLEGSGQDAWPSLRLACCGGEVLAPALARRFVERTGARLFNVYGPTEATIFATAWACGRDPPEVPLPMGRAVDDTRIYVLDAGRRLLPFGEVGEIGIGGAGLARGYLGRADLTEAAFIADPFCPGERLYLTGDLGYLDCSGNLHFAGRADRQIKLHGYRIEPGEIEAALISIEGVSRAAVMLVAVEGTPALHAWICGTLEPGEVRRKLGGQLPEYMLPSGYSRLSAMPMTPGGKINYRALPLPELPPPVIARPPAGAIETTLLGLWRKVLKQPRLGVADHFFERGGDSLSAIDLLLAVDRELGVRMSLHTLIQHPSVEQFAQALGTREALPTMRKMGGPSARPALFLAASGQGDVLRFGALAAALGEQFEVFMLVPPEDGSIRSMLDLAQIYAERIFERSVKSCYLAGFSVGGIAALETARRLVGQGVRVERLVLLDCFYPAAFLRARQWWRVLGWLVQVPAVARISVSGRRLRAMFADPGLALQVAALERYQPRPWPGVCAMVKSRELVRWQRWLFESWDDIFSGGLLSLTTPGLHGTMFSSDNVNALAAALRLSLGEGNERD